MAPFWARVLRCSASDVAQLDTFNGWRQSFEPSGCRAPFCTYGLSAIIGTSELYSYAPEGKALTYDN